MANRGAPFGNNNGGKNKPWRDALHRALTRFENAEIKKGTALNMIAERVVADAIDGGKDAYQEIANRLDGKPHQSIAMDIDDKRARSRDEILATAKALDMEVGELFDEPGDSRTAH